MSSIITIRRTVAFLLLSISCSISTGPLCAASWADSMFKIKKHDFGRVAIGAEASFSFKFQNIYEEEVRIVSVSSSCHCTEPSVTKKTLKSLETGEIIAKFNTSGQFLKDKGATLTVVFDKPYPAEVQLQITGYIRPDIVMTPGIAELGAVHSGKSVTKTVTMEYAGNPNWQLLEVRQNNPYLEAKILERKKIGGEIRYKIAVILKENAPVGYINDVLQFVTNEKQYGAQGKSIPSTIPLPVRAEVSAPLYAKPSPFQIGVLCRNESVTKNLVLRGSRPFRILGVTTDDERFNIEFSKERSSVHVLPVSFVCDEFKTEPITGRITVQTDRSDEKYLSVDIQGFLYSDETALLRWQKDARMLAMKPKSDSSGAVFKEMPTTFTNENSANDKGEDISEEPEEKYEPVSSNFSGTTEITTKLEDPIMEEFDPDDPLLIVESILAEARAAAESEQNPVVQTSDQQSSSEPEHREVQAVVSPKKKLTVPVQVAETKEIPVRKNTVVDSVPLAENSRPAMASSNMFLAHKPGTVVPISFPEPQLDYDRNAQVIASESVILEEVAKFELDKPSLPIVSNVPVQVQLPQNQPEQIFEEESLPVRKLSNNTSPKTPEQENKPAFIAKKEIVPLEKDQTPKKVKSLDEPTIRFGKPKIVQDETGSEEERTLVQPRPLPKIGLSSTSSFPHIVAGGKTAENGLSIIR